MLKQGTLLGVMLAALWFAAFTVPAGAQQGQQGGNSQGQQGGGGQGQQGGGYPKPRTSATEMTGLGLFAATLAGTGVYVLRRRSKAKPSA